jgi:hypothetical protein
MRSGNTHVTGRTASRNVFYCLLIFLFETLIARLKFPGPRLPLCLVSGQYIFFSPPTHSSLPTPRYLSCTHLHTTLSGRGGPLEGVHLPSPSSFAPRSSRLTVDSFCAPRRLPARLMFIFTMRLRISARVNGIAYLNNLGPGNCYLGPKPACTRLYCSYNSAIYFCNDVTQ